MNNEQLRTQILTYRPTSPVAAPCAANYSLFIIHYSLNYAFSAKERDTETGLSYFGARYYSSELSIWLSVDPMADKYPSLSPYVYCANNPVKLVDPNGEEFGDFYDVDGTSLGSDGKSDGKKYILNNVGIDNNTRKETRNFIKTNSGNADKFTDGCIAYKNSTEIISSSKIRAKMCAIAEQDDGRGGTNPSRNCEYGGKLENGLIVELPHGPVGDPSKNDVLEFPGEAIFHTHASGSKGDEIDIYNPQPQLSSGKPVSSWRQAPSQKDISNANTETHYVFARGSNEVYLYNDSGIHVRMSHKAFKNIP